MIIILLFCLCFAIKNYEVQGSMPNLFKNEDLELVERLKVINKPPIKTIQTEFGRLVDCIDINKQLAFDHPLLKNHKIQLKSSFQDIQTNLKTIDRSRYAKIGLDDKNVCPKGTIPVQRTTKEDLIRVKKLSNNFGLLNRFDHGSHFAGLRIIQKFILGIVGTLDVYNPPVDFGQMSSAYLRLSSGQSNISTPPTFVAIHAGWQVYPELSGDKLTHFFISWENQINHTGCTNMLCPGFVQTSRRIYLGSPVANASTYGGAQYTMSLNLTLDPTTKNWWLRAQDEDVGYFPAAIFSGKMYHPVKGGWTGHTKFSNNQPSPQMGSGHFPNGNPRHSCYISKIYFMDRYRNVHGPLRGDVAVDADNPKCYDAKYYDYVDDTLQRVMMFGGPGGDCGL